MKRLLFAAILLSTPSYGQPAPAFEAADVHKSAAAAPGTNQFMRGGFYRGGRYEARTATMIDLIRTAYGVEADKITGGPAWLTADHFDVIAKAPPASTPETLQLMLRTLLADRFGLVVHNDMKPLPAYALLQGKKLLMKPSDGPGETGCKRQQAPEPASNTGRFMISDGSTVLTFAIDQLLTYNCRNVTMKMFAGEFSNLLFGNAYLNNYPVVDQTDLKGEWNFDLKYSLKIQMLGPPRDVQTVTLFDAVEKQLGMKLELTKIPMPVIAVDSVNETPTPNLPGVSEKMPEGQTEFEVADIKPSDPNPAPGPMMNTMFQPGGRVNIRNNTLRDLIRLAWNMNGNDNNTVVGAPKFVETDRWDILAKASTTAPLNPPSGGLLGPAPAATQTVDFDSMRVMLQNLLKDRFKLVLHEEERPMSGYALVAVKPKLKKADPSNRPGCNEGPGPDGKDPRTTNPAANRLFTCLNTTMAEFAAVLPNRAGGYFQQFPGGVVDATKIEGTYDFTLNFSGAGMVGGGGRGGPAAGAGATGEASDPGGAISLQEAIEKQLGLKLEPQKNTGTVLVIDHIEQKPTEN